MYTCANKEKPSLFIQPHHTAALTGHIRLQPDCKGYLKDNSRLLTWSFCFRNLYQRKKV